jgi:hypothetical protein
MRHHRRASGQSFQVTAPIDDPAAYPEYPFSETGKHHKPPEVAPGGHHERPGAERNEIVPDHLLPPLERARM